METGTFYPDRYHIPVCLLLVFCKLHNWSAGSFFISQIPRGGNCYWLRPWYQWMATSGCVVQQNGGHIERLLKYLLVAGLHCIFAVYALLWTVIKLYWAPHLYAYCSMPRHIHHVRPTVKLSEVYTRLFAICRLCIMYMPKIITFGQGVWKIHSKCALASFFGPRSIFKLQFDMNSVSNILHTCLYSMSQAHHSSAVSLDCDTWSSCWHPSHWRCLIRSICSVTCKEMYVSYSLLIMAHACIHHSHQA